RTASSACSRMREGMGASGGVNWSGSCPQVPQSRNDGDEGRQRCRGRCSGIRLRELHTTVPHRTSVPLRTTTDVLPTRMPGRLSAARPLITRPLITRNGERGTENALLNSDPSFVWLGCRSPYAVVREYGVVRP